MDRMYLLIMMDAHAIAVLHKNSIFHAQNDHMDVLNSIERMKAVGFCVLTVGGTFLVALFFTGGRPLLPRN